MIAIFSGYLLWIFISKVVTPEIIGISSTIISLMIIFSSIVDMGVSAGATRFLARSFSERRSGDTRVLVKSSLLIVFSGLLFCSAAIVAFRDWVYPNIELNLVLLTIPLIGTLVIASLLRSILVASLDTKSLPKIMIISSICKIISTVILVLLGTGVIGITMGYLWFYLSALVILSFLLVTKIMPTKKEPTIRLFHTCKDILIAGVPIWIPQIISIIGMNLGTIIVFGIAGANQAGTYFIATSIFHGISSIRGSLFEVGFPVVSSMDDKRKRLVWKLMKMSLVITLPISSTFIAYSEEVMMLIGSDFQQGSLPLKILMLSMLPGTISAGIAILVYSYGNYWKVLAIGLGATLSRVLFYFMLVPLYGNIGAAVGGLVGSIVGFVVSLMVAKKIGLSIFWKELGLTFVIPMGLAFVFEYFGVNYMIGIPAILVICILLYIRSHILSKSEIHEYLEMLPNRIGKPLIDIINRL